MITEMEEDARNGDSRKRMKLSDEEGKGDSKDGINLDNIIESEETETNLVASEEMEHNISQILDKIASFTQTLKVTPILPGECSFDVNWVDEVEDLSIDYLLKTIENGLIFSKNDLLGGCEKLPTIMDEPSSLKGKTLKRDSKKDQRSQVQQLAESSKENPTTDIAEMMKEIDKMILEMLPVEKTTMGYEIVGEVLRVLREPSISNLEAENTCVDICEETVEIAHKFTDVSENLKETETNCPREDFEVMTGKESPDHPDRSGKKKISLVDTAGSSNFFGQYEFLVTEHEILKENHETLKKDYEILEETFKLEKEVSDMLKVHHQKETKELETKLERLVKDLAKEKSEKEMLKKEMERLKSKAEKEEKELKKMKNMCGELEKKCESEENFKKKMEKVENENKATINDLKNKNQKLLSAKEALEEKLTKLETKHVELGEKFVMVKKECSYEKSLYDAEKLSDLGGNDVAIKKEVIVVDDHNMNKAIADPIMILDDSDAESDNAGSKSNKVPQRSVDTKQIQQFDVPNSSKVDHNLPSSSSSSSSSDEFVIVQLPFKRPRV